MLRIETQQLGGEAQEIGVFVGAIDHLDADLIVKDAVRIDLDEVLLPLFLGSHLHGAGYAMLVSVF